MRTVRRAPGAIADIRRILRRSKAEFGAGAGARYKVLLDQALQDLGEDPRRVGVKAVPAFLYRDLHADARLAVRRRPGDARSDPRRGQLLGLTRRTRWVP